MESKRRRDTAMVEAMARLPWRQFPGHFGGALSKVLAGPENCGSQRIDFRISRYSPAAYVEEHVHQVQEQVYYVLEGEGMLTADGEQHLMRPHDYIWIPPGVKHGFSNTGTAGLVFLVITTPADDREAQ